MSNQHFFLQQPHIRKQWDSKFRQSEELKRENLRVSQWFDRYIQQANHWTDNELLKKHSLPFGSREDSRFVEKQTEILLEALKMLNDANKKSEFFNLKNQIRRTLNIVHQQISKKFIDLHWEE